MRMRQIPLLFQWPVLLAALGVAACSLAPDYAPPAPLAQGQAVPASYKESQLWKPAAPADDATKGQWWLAFGDDGLNRLEDHIAPVDQTTSANQTLQAGLARLAQAKAAAQLARSALFPQIGAVGSAARLGRSATTLPPVNPRDYTDDKLSLDVSYEVDVWGRVQNAIEAAKDEAQASAADLGVLELALRAELATDYFSLRGADSSIAVLDQTISANQAALDLVTRRHAGGIATQADLVQATAQVETAKTQAADLRLKRAQLEHAISILIGQAPSGFQLPPHPLSGEPPPISPGLPSTLLERRPDIAAAERRVAEANAQIGVANAAWYPEVDLGALVGLESGSPGSLFQAASAIWALGPGMLTQTIYDGGRRQALSDQALAAHTEAVANYRQTVLSAWREVEDQLAASRHLEQESGTQQKAVDALHEALAQAKYRYQAGIATYLEVVVTQNAVLAAELTATDIYLRRLNADVLLIKGLGGGWRPDAKES